MPAVTGDTVTIHFYDGFISSSSTTNANQINPDKTYGYADDPIWASDGSFLTLAGTSLTSTDVTADDAKFSGLTRVGYNFSKWVMTFWNGQQNKWQLMAGTTSIKGFATAIKNAKNTTFNIYAIWTDAARVTVNFVDTGTINYPAPYTGMRGYMDVLTVPASSNQFIPDGATSGVKTGDTVSDALDLIYHFRGSNRAKSAYPTIFTSFNIYETEAEISFQVTYNPNGGTGSAQTVTYTTSSPNATADGTAAGAEPITLSRAGYNFLGWATTSSATSAQINDKAALSPVLACANNGVYNLYAVWEVIKYDVSLVYNQGYTGTPAAGSMPSNPAAVKVNHGGTFTTTVSNNTPTRTGYSFEGWATTSNGTVAYAKGATLTQANITAATTITLYAVWKAWPTITYDGNGHTGGTVPASVTVEPTKTHNISAGVPVKTGYVFAGWTTSQNVASGTKYSNGGSITGTTGTFTMPTTNVTFYALWNPTITYNGNKPSNDTTTSTSVTGLPGTNPVTVAYGSNTTAAAAPSLVGWTFAGWAESATGNVAYAAGAAINNLTTSKTLYAKWTVKSGYSVVFYDQQSSGSDGTAYNTQSNLNWLSGISLPSGTPVKTGYTFDGWYTTKSNDSATGTKITSVSTFNKLWEVMKAAGQATDTSTQLKVYARWIEKDKVTLTLNLNADAANPATYNGSNAAYEVRDILNGGSASIPATGVIENPSRPGYNFKGWTVSSAGTGTVYQGGYTFTNMTASKTLYAKWEAAVVTFTFDKNATASEVTSHKTPDPYTMTANYGGTIAVPSGTSVYTRTSYNFDKWTYTNSSNATANIAAAGATVTVANFKITWTGDSAKGTLAGTVTITANWTPFTYTISWDHNYSGRPAPATTTNRKPTDTVTLPAVPTRSGYTFKGWNTLANGTGNSIATGNSVAATWSLADLPSGSTLVAYAQWEEEKVQIRVYGDGSKSGVQYSDGSEYISGTVLYVGKSTGDIYASSSATTSTGANISKNFKPLISDARYEFSSAHGSKWTKGSANGTQVATTETLTIPKNNGLYETGDYYLTVSPKWYSYTVEYYQQNTTGTGYTKVSAPTGATASGTAPYQYSLEIGTSAGTNDSTKKVTITRGDFTGFTYNASAPGAVASIAQISDTVANNVLKLYFDRNQFNVSVTYSGTVPASAGAYSPATQTKRFGETVTLTAPAAVDGYTFEGWTLKNSVTGLTANQVKSGSFTMPNGAVTIEGVWSKVKYNVLFVNDATNGNISGTLAYQLPYGNSLTATPGIVAKDADSYYFMGWELFEGCTSSSTTTVTGGTSKGIMSAESILGADGNAPWTVSSHTRFVARFGKTVAVTYSNGGANAFVVVNGSMVGGTVTQKGTYYTKLALGWALPAYGGAFDAAGDRNALNPHAAPGYKFVGWEWVDAVASGTTKRAVGHYDSAKNFVLDSGDALPTTIDQSFTFTAIWTETTQQIHFVPDCVNISGVTVSPTPADIQAKTNQVVNLPAAPAYGAAANPTAYTFKGWTTVSSGYVQGTSPLYTGTFTMTAGTRSNSVYTLPDAAADGGYGITLYPVFEENIVTIQYKLATGCTNMGTLSSSTEGNNFKMVSGSPNGSSATAETGYQFKGWFKDAAHTIPVTASWVSSDNRITPQKNGGIYEAATYYAYFEPMSYTIKFQVGDHGTWTDGSAASAEKSASLVFKTNYGTNVPTYSGTTAAMKANTGYGFKEWAEINPTTGAVIRTLSDSALRSELATADRTFKAVWEERSGYTVVYNTMGGGPTLSNQQVTWTANLQNTMTATAKTGMVRQGYTFAGWYTKNDYSDAGVSATTTFADGVTMAGIPHSGDDPVTLELFAKWTEKTFTLKYAPSWPGSTTTSFSNKTVSWTQTNLLPAGAVVLVETGFDFKNWNTASNSTGLIVTNDTPFSAIYQRLYGNTDNAKTEATIYGTWGQRTFTVQFKNEAGTVVKTYNNVNFNSTVDYYNYAPADGSKSLLGWRYTPAGGTQQTWQAANSGTPLSVSVFDGTPSPADGSTFILTAWMQDNAKYTINYYTVNVDANGNPIMAQANKLNSVSGFAPVGTAINIADGSFNATNYISKFEMQNGAGRRTDLKGYELKTIPGQTKISAEPSEVTSGGTVTFNVYFVEKIFTITYDRGVDALGNPCPVTVTMPEDKNASWNSSNILPETTPVWEGYKAPKWQYKNATGTWTNLSTGAKVKDITTSDDNTNPITLRAFWESDVVVLTFNSQTGGAIGGSIIVGSGQSKNMTIDSVNGPAPTVKATAGTGYIFLGWYKDGVELTTNDTYTVTPVDGLFSSATYEARFRALDSIAYTIHHYFEDAATGNFIERTELLETRNGQENDSINKDNSMVKTVKGFTHQTGISGEKLHIASLGDSDNDLKLYYRVNMHDVWVSIVATGADAPTPTPAPAYAATGITQSHTTQAFGVQLELPGVTVPDGWGFQWKVTYRDSDSTSDTERMMAPGATFAMVDANVNIVGVWDRQAHKVTFVAGTGAHGTVAVIAPATLPFTVNHGKSLNDASASGNSNNIKVTADDKWALAGWSYIDENGVERETQDPDSVIINIDTTFTAKWAQTFSVIYAPGAHGGIIGSDDFTKLVVVEKDIALAANKNVSTVPFVLNGNNYDSSAPAAAGYNFIGWSWTRNGQKYYQIMNAPSAGFSMAAYGIAGTRNWVIDENVTFTAIWEAAEQTLTFLLGSGSPAPAWTPSGQAAGTTGNAYVVTPSPRTDQVVTLLGHNDISREGYTLAGWIQVDSSNRPIGSTIAPGGTFTMPANPATFMPVWEFEQMQIKYVIATGSDGRGTLDSSADNIINAGVSQLKGSLATANAGYKFDGWYSDAACTQRVDHMVTSTAPDPNDPTAIISAKLQPQKPTTGWVPVTYYAKFVPGKAEYTIEYYLQEVDGSYTKANITPNRFADIDSEQKADVTDPTNAAYAHRLNTASAAYAGYVFNDNAYGQVLEAIVNPDGSTTLKLYYDLQWFNIVYDLGTNGDAAGTWAGEAGPARAVGNGMVIIPEARLTGMSLTGWNIVFTDADGNEQVWERGSSFQMPFYNVKAIAQWAKNVDFKVVVYEAEWVNGRLVATEKVVPSMWPGSFAAGDGVATITVNNGTVTLTAPNAQGSTFFPKTYNMPRLAGYEYLDACQALGIYNTTDAPLEGGYKVMKIYLAPKTGYRVHYVDADTGATIAADRIVNWHDANLGVTTLPANYAGYEYDGYGWMYKSAGDFENVAPTDTYEDIVVSIYGQPRDTIKEITLYAKIKALAYKVIFADDTNGIDETATTILEGSDYNWNSNVALSDPATFTPAYNKANYKWMGWEIRKADGSKVTLGASSDYKTLAGLLGLNATTALENGVTVYAVWAEWLPVTIEFYTKDSNGETKFHQISYPASDQKLYAGGTYTVPEALVTTNRPVGYVFDKVASIMQIIGDAAKDNICKVIYNEANGFKLFLNTNYGANANAQTITGLSWTSKPDSKATAVPTRMGWRLADKPHRWNTKADGTGHDFDADATYAQIAEWIYGAALDDAAILASGLTLFAQWSIADDFEVIYDLNNDRNTNNKIQTDVPDFRYPMDVADLNKTGVAWTDSGFDQSNDTELDAAPFGYVFNGWNTKADGTGLQITNNMTYAEISNYLNPNVEAKSIKLYAQWTELEVEIKYTVDNEEAGSIDRFLDKIKAVSGEHDPIGSSSGTKLQSVAKANPGWHFVRWEVVVDGRARAISNYANEVAYQGADGSTIVVNPDTASGRLYGAEYRAVFERNPEAQVEYDSNGGDGVIPPFAIPHGSYFTMDDGSGFKRAHYTLKGWNTKADGTGTHYSLSQANMVMPEAGMKLYAEWDINSYGVTTNEPEKGGSIVPGSTEIKYGEKIPASFVASLNPQPNPGWSLTGWKYTMTNAETGEVIEGFTTDLTSLTIEGPISLTPVFDGADPIVDGPPRTGDDARYEFELMLAALWTALAAAIAMLILLVAARRRRTVEETSAQLVAETNGVYGTHAITWGDGRATRMLRASGFGKHSVRRDGMSVARVERELQAACDDVAGCESREDFVSRAIAKGMGAHAKAQSAFTSDDELRTSSCGAHSVAAAGRGKHSIPVLSNEAASGAVERIGVSEGQHSVSKAGERVSERLVASYGEHSVRRSDDGVWESFAAIKAPQRPAAPKMRERIASGLSSLRPRVSGAGQHEISAAPVAAQAEPAVAVMSSTSASAPVSAVSALVPETADAASTSASAPVSYKRNIAFNRARQINAIFVALADRASLAPMPPRTTPASERRALSRDHRRGATRPSRHFAPGATYCAPEILLDSTPPQYDISSVGVSARLTSRFNSRAARIALGVPTFALAMCLGFFGVGAHLAPSAAYADEMPGQSDISMIQGDNSAQKPSSEGTTVPLDGSTVPSSGSGTDTGVASAADANTAENGSELSSADDATNTIEDASKASENGSEGSEGVEKASEATENAADAVENSADANQNGSSDAAGSESGSDNDADSSKKDSPRHENDGDNGSDSTHSDNPPAPVDDEASGNSPADLPSEDGDYQPASSGDDSYIASTITPKDSNAPPGARVDSPPPPVDGTYFIRWEKYPTYWMGQENEKLIVKVNPESTSALDWVLSYVNGTAYDNVYTLRNGGLYLARCADFPISNDVELSGTLNENAYWRIVPFSNSKGQVVYFLYDMNENDALTFAQDADLEVEGVICNSYGKDMYSLGSYYRFFFDEALPQDWTIKYDGNGATEGTTVKSEVTVATGGTISDCGYSRFGYEFTGWNTEADGSGTTYRAGDHIPGGNVLASNFVMRLFAQWQEIFADITYNTTGGGDVQLGDDAESKNSNIIQVVGGATGILKDTDDTPLQGVTAVADNGYHFSSWQISGGIGEISDLLKSNPTLTADQVRVLSRVKDDATGWTLYKNMVLTADFLPNKYTINFDANRGTGSMAAKMLYFGEINPVTAMDGLSRVSYRFAGWNTKSDGSGIAVSDSATLEQLIADGVLRNVDGAICTLFAMWEEDPNAGGNFNPGNLGSDIPISDGGSGFAGPSAGANNASNGGSAARYGYSRYFGGYSASSDDSASTIEPATLTETPAITNGIKTITPKNAGPFAAIGQFFSTGTGRIVGIICGAGVAIAVIAGIAALVMHLGAAGAAGGAAGGVASGAQAAKPSRFRKLFGKK